MHRILYPLVALASAAVVAFSAIDVIEAVRAVSWPTTEGTIYSSRLIAKGELHGRFSSPAPVYTYEVTIEYQANGQTYYKTIRTITSLRSLLISYNPKKPIEVWIGTKGPSVLEILLLLAAIGAFVFTGLKWAKGK